MREIGSRCGIPNQQNPGRNLKGSFYRGVFFRKGVRVSIGVPGGGVWGRVRVVGGGFPLESVGKGKGGGERGIRLCNHFGYNHSPI